MNRSLLVQTLIDMATGSGGAKLEALIVDAAGTFDAGSGKGYNPVTVPSGSINVLGEKGVVSNNSVVVTPKAQVVKGWVNGGETSGSGVGVTASELVSGTLNVSSDGVQDVTNYQNISVPSAGHTASAHKGVVTDHSIIVTPRSTATQGFVQAGTVEGAGVSVSASELVSGSLNITESGTFDVTNYAQVVVSVAGYATFTFWDSASVKEIRNQLFTTHTKMFYYCMDTATSSTFRQLWSALFSIPEVNTGSHYVDAWNYNPNNSLVYYNQILISRTSENTIYIDTQNHPFNGNYGVVLLP